MGSEMCIRDRLSFNWDVRTFSYIFTKVGSFGSIYIARVKNISPRTTSGSPKDDPVRFEFLKTREPRVKFRVGTLKNNLSFTNIR